MYASDLAAILYFLGLGVAAKAEIRHEIVARAPAIKSFLLPHQLTLPRRDK